MADLTQLSRRSVLALPFVLMACQPSPEVFSISGPTMGTTYNVVVIDSDQRLNEGQIRNAVERAFDDVLQQMSNWDPNSEISQFNARTDTAPVAVSPALAEIMQAAEMVYRDSDGRFDTTMGPLIELWGFGASNAPEIPSDAEIEEALLRSGHDRTLIVGEGVLQKRQPHVQVYLAAIGKGYGADKAAEALEALGARNYMIEIGGDIYASGHNQDGLPWQIGIETPSVMGGGVADVVGISGLGLASSGDYRNFFEDNGRRYSHIIDPQTGRPITHSTASATVLADSAMLADAWATAMLTLGSERGRVIAEAHNIAVMFIDREGEGAQMRFTAVTSSRFDALTA